MPVREAIRLDGVTIGDYFRCVSCVVPRGSLAAIITARQEENDLLVKLLLGQARAELGKIHVLGEDVAGLSVNSLYELRRGIAVVPPSGGLVSNLNVWENLVLPCLYHTRDAAAAIEKRGMAVLEQVGYTGELTDLPGLLTTYGRRMIVMARGMLSESSLMVYNAVLDGLNGNERERVIAVAREFHRQVPERASLFVSSSPEIVNFMEFDTIIRLKGGVFHD